MIWVPDELAAQFCSAISAAKASAACAATAVAAAVGGPALHDHWGHMFQRVTVKAPVSLDTSLGDSPKSSTLIARASFAAFTPSKLALCNHETVELIRRMLEIGRLADESGM